MIKKFLCIILSVMMLFAVAGCQGKKKVKYASDIKTVTAAPGAIEGKVYKSDFAGLKFTLPDDSWSFKSKEELQKMSEEAGKNSGMTFDMMCTKGDKGPSVMVMYDNMLKTYGQIFSIEDYVEKAKEQMYNMNYDIIDESEETICGNVYQYMELAGKTDSDNSSYRQYIYMRKIGKYVISIDVGILDKSNIKDILSSFN
ncbi:MAG: hypothetical protein Q8882_04055 [Bacillota bacterium]|nr:hypothetical protein [Bacillota bacterium]